jgi:hypothetical protein
MWGAAPERDLEPPLPEEARREAVHAAAAASVALEAGPASELHVRFKARVGFDRAVAAMEAFKAVLNQRRGIRPSSST